MCIERLIRRKARKSFFSRRVSYWCTLSIFIVITVLTKGLGRQHWLRAFLQYSKISSRSTVDSRYLEFQGTVWNSSRYPYLNISGLQNWGKINRTTTFHKCIRNLTPGVRSILKILWKRGEIAPISPLFHNILLPIVRFSCLNRDQIFTSR